MDPNVVYFTEKGGDLSRIVPELDEIERHRPYGGTWYDMMVRGYRPGYVPKVRVVFTTEAELAKIREAAKQSELEKQAAEARAAEEALAAEEARVAEEARAADEARVVNALAELSAYEDRQNRLNGQLFALKSVLHTTPKKQRTQDTVADIVADHLAFLPECIQEEFLVKITKYIFAQRLIYTPISKITPAFVPTATPQKAARTPSPPTRKQSATLDPVIRRIVQTTPPKKTRSGIRMHTLPFDMPRMMTLIKGF